LNRLTDEDVLQCSMLKLRCVARKDPIRASPSLQIAVPVVEEERNKSAENRAAGLAALDDEDICIALRSAMHVKGPTDEPLSQGARDMLAGQSSLLSH